MICEETYLRCLESVAPAENKAMRKVCCVTGKFTAPAVRSSNGALGGRRRYNPLKALTINERADYDLLTKNGHSREEAFRAIGRLDILEANK